jgi:hypothetical protein
MSLRAAATLAPIALTTPTLANAVLPIDGIFGNPSGCAYFMTGNLEGDEAVVLTPDTFTTYASGCYFIELLDGLGDVFTIAATCTAEGETSSSHETVRIFDNGPEGIVVELIGVGEFGPIFPCPGTDVLFERGVQI